MATERPAKAKRILVVEDEPMIRMLLEDMLGELGYTVAAEAAGIEEALEATKNADFDVAMLDANLDGEPPRRLPMPLWAAARRFVFATGYGELPKPYRDRPTLRKPFQIDASRACCRARCRALVSNSSFRVWGHLGRGKGRRGLAYLRLFAF